MQPLITSRSLSIYQLCSRCVGAPLPGLVRCESDHLRTHRLNYRDPQAPAESGSADSGDTPNTLVTIELAELPKTATVS